MRSLQPSAASTASALPIWAVAFPASSSTRNRTPHSRGARQLILPETLGAPRLTNDPPDFFRRHDSNFPLGKYRGNPGA